MKSTFTLALVLGFVAVALAADVPKDADKPVETDQPAVIDKPAVTDQPAVTDKPAVTDQPAGTDKPVDPVKPAEPGSCDTTAHPAGKFYKDSSSGKGLFGAWDCMKYRECAMGVEIVHHCFYFIPLKQYNPSTRSCEWFWKAHCHDDDPSD